MRRTPPARERSDTRRRRRRHSRLQQQQLRWRLRLRYEVEFGSLIDTILNLVLTTVQLTNLGATRRVLNFKIVCRGVFCVISGLQLNLNLRISPALLVWYLSQSYQI